MQVTLLDTLTGERRDCSAFGNFTVYWWQHGNGSCDCNRALAFDKEGEDHGADQQQRLGLEDNICLGAERWLIVGATGDLEGGSEADVVAESNDEYPQELVEKSVGGCVGLGAGATLDQTRAPPKKPNEINELDVG